MRTDVAHVHKCYKCGTMWQHMQVNSETTTNEEYHKLHNCPNPACDANQRWIHHYVGDHEEYKGEWEDQHQEFNRRLPGGKAGGTKTYIPELEESFADVFLRFLKGRSNA